LRTPKVRREAAAGGKAVAEKNSGGQGGMGGTRHQVLRRTLGTRAARRHGGTAPGTLWEARAARRHGRPLFAKACLTKPCKRLNPPICCARRVSLPRNTRIASRMCTIFRLSRVHFLGFWPPLTRSPRSLQQRCGVCSSTRCPSLSATPLGGWRSKTHVQRAARAEWQWACPQLLDWCLAAIAEVPFAHALGHLLAPGQHLRKIVDGCWHAFPVGEF